MKLVILDRDGVLNKIIIHPEFGTVDSPMNPSEVEVFEGVPDAVLALNGLGFDVAIATNQPSWAKGKTSKENLDAVQKKVISVAESRGGKILGSFICYHKAEDGCDCRKPKPGMLLQALNLKSFDLGRSWMVGDGVTDVQAGVAAGLKTAFVGPKRCDICKVIDPSGIWKPNIWVNDISEFVRQLTKN